MIIDQFTKDLNRFSTDFFLQILKYEFKSILTSFYRFLQFLVKPMETDFVSHTDFWILALDALGECTQLSRPILSMYDVPYVRTNTLSDVGTLLYTT
jgi:hypothetical protein